MNVWKMQDRTNKCSQKSCSQKPILRYNTLYKDEIDLAFIVSDVNYENKEREQHKNERLWATHYFSHLKQLYNIMVQKMDSFCIPNLISFKTFVHYVYQNTDLNKTFSVHQNKRLLF